MKFEEYNETKKDLLPTTGIEPVTFALQERRSTTELNRHIDSGLKKFCQHFYTYSFYLEINFLLFFDCSVSSFLKLNAHTKKERKKKRELPAK